MRVISGTAKRLLLKTLKGNEIRPTTDKIKETLFNIINPDIYSANFLDLFAGSGAIGIEALSRGAKKAVFVEKNRQAVKCINDNLIHTKLNDKAFVIAGDVLSILKSHRLHECFDFIFMDPPYYEDLYFKVLDVIKENQILSDNGTVILECDSKYADSFQNIDGFITDRIKNYKNISHIFLKGV